MTDLFTPGDHRAGELLSDRSFVETMIEIEWAWYAELVEAGIAPQATLPTVRMSAEELADLAEATEAAGNPVTPLLHWIRGSVPEPVDGAWRWLHRGLTSQDVVDTAIMIMLRQAAQRICVDLAEQIETLARLADEHRSTLCAGRTLTQHAVPTTFGLVAATWLTGVLDVADDLDDFRPNAVLAGGGAAGTDAAADLLTVGRAELLRGRLADRLGLRSHAGWHTTRRPITRLSDTLVAACDAWGRIGNDVALRSRPEIGELDEGAAPGRGGSSTMPHKRNPVLSLLLRRTALNAPFLGAAVHAGAAATVDQRSDGGWHAEWAPLRTLARLSVTAASQTTELLAQLRVNVETMERVTRADAADLLAEARSIAQQAGVEAPTDPADYLGTIQNQIDSARDRAGRVLTELRS